MSTFNIALIGYGLGGRIFHAPFIDTVDGFTISKIATSNPTNIALAQQQFPTATIIQDYQEALNDENIDIIVLAIPNSFHFQYAARALEAGKHVVVEKPFTINSEEAELLIRLAQQKGLLLTVHHNRRWDSDYLTIRKVIADGLLGDLMEYEAHFDRFRNYIKPNAWKEKPEEGSGILYDLGSHLIDQALQLFGIPQGIFADLRSQRANSTVVDNFELILYYEQVKVSLKAGMLVRQDLPRYILLGREGTFVKHGKDPQEEALINGRLPKNHSNWGMEPKPHWGTIDTTIGTSHLQGTIESVQGNYGIFYHNLHETLLGHNELLVKPEEAWAVIKVIEKAIESNREKRVVGM